MSHAANTNSGRRGGRPLVLTGPGGDYRRALRSSDLSGGTSFVRGRLILTVIAVAEIALLMLAAYCGS